MIQRGNSNMALNRSQATGGAAARSVSSLATLAPIPTALPKVRTVQCSAVHIGWWRFGSLTTRLMIFACRQPALSRTFSSVNSERLRELKARSTLLNSTGHITGHHAVFGTRRPTTPTPSLEVPCVACRSEREPNQPAHSLTHSNQPTLFSCHRTTIHDRWAHRVPACIAPLPRSTEARVSE